MIIPVRKLALITLALYWPVLIFFAHIPVPDSVRSAHVSDKSLHFQAYLLLTFLLWSSIKPHEKVNWRKIPAWLVLLGLTIYGAIDEVIQGHIGRSCDMMDLVTNVLGIFTGLVLLSFLSFLPAALLICGTIIFGIANVAKSDMTELFPLAYGVFHFFAYSIFTAIWILNMDSISMKKPGKLKWLITAVSLPVCFLLVVRLSSFLLGRTSNLEDFIVPLAAIITIAATKHLIPSVFPRLAKLN